MNQSTKQFAIWAAALVVGAVIGLLHIDWIEEVFNFIATVYTRLFQFLAVPTVALAIVTTMISFGKKRSAKRLFARTLTYTLLTTFAAALVGMLLYMVIAPGNIPSEMIPGGQSPATGTSSFKDHIISVIPDNIVAPLLSGNVLSILIIAFAFGIGIAAMKESRKKETVINFFEGLQELFFILIRALIKTLPLGIACFAAQLSSQLSGGVILGSLGKWALVVLLGNVIQFAVILPLFLLARGINPLKTLKAMTPAVLMALFTKSSAATLPVTISSAEERMGADKRVSRFVLPVCCTVNMNGCAAFILVTSLFVMQNSGMTLSVPTMLLWVLISVFAAVGNAGVPMGCFFLTVSLMTGIGAPVAIMGLILPIYTIVDMVETAENVWSDSCVCAMTDKDMKGKFEDGE
ncbi:MAG: dicarboxylate/amino acid:cation symporter [Bacteroidales bacterium]|nr:dicarboxylate/amino acid:cation symporter [Bacteroidales bacterium]